MSTEPKPGSGPAPLTQRETDRFEAFCDALVTGQVCITPQIEAATGRRALLLMVIIRKDGSTFGIPIGEFFPEGIETDRFVTPEFATDATLEQRKSLGGGTAPTGIPKPFSERN